MIFCCRVILVILPKCKLIWPHSIKKFCHCLCVSILSIPEPISEKYLSVLEAEGSFWISTLMRPQGLAVWRTQAFPAMKHMLAKEAKLLPMCTLCTAVQWGGGPWRQYPICYIFVHKSRQWKSVGLWDLLYETYFKEKNKMTKAAFARSWHWAIRNSSLSDSSSQLGMA